MAAIAIPVILLGSLYILSEQEKTNKLKKPYRNPISTTQSANNIENFSNYKDERISDLEEEIKTDNQQYYLANQHTDKFFNQPNQPNQPNQDIKHNINLLNGNNINEDDFKHNNMKPFFGAKIRGYSSDLNTSESILDSKQGTGSQIYNKIEQAPLFSPNENLHYKNGTPNNSDFFQSRINESMKISNVSTTQSQIVGPGLNLGYGVQDSTGVNIGGTNGEHGFNNGMMARELWAPKNVDNLRVETKPKVSFNLDGHQGPAINPIKTMGNIGKTEKHLPDKYFENTQNRWFTTTGIEKAQPIRSTYVLPNENRASTTQEYYGTGGSLTGQANYVENKYEESTKINLGQLPFGNASISNKQHASPSDYGMTSYNMLNNNRSTDKNQEFGGVYGMVRAAITPILDIIRPTRKENAIGNIRQTGNVKGVNQEIYVYNPNDKTKTTNREMSSGKIGFNHLNVQRQLENNNMAQIAEYQAVQNQRDTTNQYYVGGGSNNQGIKPYDQVYNIPNNFDKTFESRTNHGNTQTFTPNTNMEVNRNENIFTNNRQNIMNGGPNVVPSTNFIGEVQGMQSYSQQFQDARIDSSLLTAFKKNPYTQSLTSVS